MIFLHPFIFIFGFIVGFMAGFESWGIPRRQERTLEPVNRRMVDMVKRQA